MEDKEEVEKAIKDFLEDSEYALELDNHMLQNEEDEDDDDELQEPQLTLPQKMTSPQRKVENDMDFELEFCRNYANIQISEEASFEQRMQFDIYKRSTKLQR
jgi:hypothetical protein